MQLTEREASSLKKRETVVFNSLSVDGTLGKIRATVDERMLCLETKSGHALDIKINSIARVHHHHTKLIPFGFAFIGFALVWIGMRILSHQTFQLISLLLGISLILGWLFTRKPTITIDTEAGDCHAITGNDASLLRLNTILLRLQQGFTISESQEGLESFDRSTEYPRSAIMDMASVPVAPVEIQAPESIATFLEAELGNFLFDEPQPLPEPISPPATSITNPENEIVPILPSWLDNPRPESQSNTLEPLIQKGIENVEDRRGHQSAHPMSLFNQIDSVSQIQYDQNTATSPQRGTMRSEPIYPHSRELAGRSILPEPLPNFCSKEGFHMPQQNVQPAQDSALDYGAFSSPDSVLGHVDEYGEEVESLVALARNANNNAGFSNISEYGDPIQQKFPRLRPKNKLSNSRLKPKTRVGNSETRGVFRNIMIPAANRVANSVREATTNLSNRIRLGRNESKSSQSAEELRTRSSETHQQEIEENFKNLAISNGGLLPDEKVRELEEIALRRKAISEQVEQEEIEILEDFTFGDLIDSDANKSKSGGKEGLPRIDS